jgi:hypothetical protein
MYFYHRDLNFDNQPPSRAVVQKEWRYTSVSVICLHAVVYRGVGFGVFNPPPKKKSEILTKLSRIPSSVENTSVTT